MEKAVTKSMQEQIDALNKKMDIILEEIYVQRQKRQEVEDLLTDLSIIGNDLFKATVDELDHAGVEVDGEAVKTLVFRLMRNVSNLNEILGMTESAVDLARDVAPILHQVGLDSINYMHELEQKGYIDFGKAVFEIVDNIVTHFTVEDVKLLADNVVTILETVKNLTQPEMLHAMNNAVNIYKTLETHDIEEMSLWRTFKELRSPEMKKGLGFMITFLKNVAKETAKNNGKESK